MPDTPKGHKRPSSAASDSTPTKAGKKKSVEKTAADIFTRPKSLAVDEWIEAQDCEQLWFPAHVMEVARTEVLIHFDGWDEQWNEWIPKSSDRLREHRGWGTSMMPKDWQKDAEIEALDMEGKWYKAKVLHVSEIACKVHYGGWAKKWDEWVKKDSGRYARPPRVQQMPHLPEGRLLASFLWGRSRPEPRRRPEQPTRAHACPYTCSRMPRCPRSQAAPPERKGCQARRRPRREPR